MQSMERLGDSDGISSLSRGGGDGVTGDGDGE
jgi:hypothetical protein